MRLKLIIAIKCIATQKHLMQRRKEAVFITKINCLSLQKKHYESKNFTFR